MFGIGGGELIFIMFIVLLLFGSDKVPEMARGMGKMMAQLKNATNDIKNEIQKGVDDNGFDQKMLSDLTNNITSEINSAKANILGNTNPLSGISDSFKTEINTVKENLVVDTSEAINGVSTAFPAELNKVTRNAKKEVVGSSLESPASITAETGEVKVQLSTEINTPNTISNEEIEDIAGPIKRKK